MDLFFSAERQKENLAGIGFVPIKKQFPYLILGIVFFGCVKSIFIN
jgi:hypothetical protein